ncbi:MAG: DivIVA domain-containing protein [Actinomycetota bacterium]
MFGRTRRGEERDGARAEARAGGRLTPVDVQGVQFRLAFRGYNERDVDAFLDRVTEDLAARIEEREQLLRAGGGAEGAAASGDFGAARTEADAIVARAHAEASEILRAAMAQASALRSVGADGADARASLAPFLNRERDFLARIGEIVQSHAEEIRAMVMALRAAAPERSTEAPEFGSARSEG